MLLVPPPANNAPRDSDTRLRARCQGGARGSATRTRRLHQRIQPAAGVHRGHLRARASAAAALAHRHRDGGGRESGGTHRVVRHHDRLRCCGRAGAWSALRGTGLALRASAPDPHALLLAHQARFVMEAGRFQLLETAAQAIARLLLTAPAPDEERGVAQSVRVTLIKPEALPGSAVPSVSVLGLEALTLSLSLSLSLTLTLTLILTLTRWAPSAAPKTTRRSC